MISALIFDYFGVVRTTGLRSAYQALGGDLAKDEAFVADVTTAADYGFITNADEQLAGRLGVPVAVWREAMSGVHGNDPQLLAYIATIHRAKTFKTGLLSNAGPGVFEHYFAAGEIEQYFDATLASGDVGCAKPEALFYRMMAEELGVAPEACIMIDDRQEFCRGAEYVGMKTIHYQHFDQFQTDLAKILAHSQNQSIS